MPYELFVERFGDLAVKETRSVMPLNNTDLPNDDEYGLFELFCTDKNCDCRRVIFNVISKNTEKVVAVVGYGWESAAFYEKWYGDNNPKAIKALQGPELNIGSPQSKLAPAILELVKGVLKDENYVARIKRHYKMFKETVDRKPAKFSPSVNTQILPKLPAVSVKPDKPELPARKSRKRHHPRSTDN